MVARALLFPEKLQIKPHNLQSSEKESRKFTDRQKSFRQKIWNRSANKYHQFHIDSVKRGWQDLSY